MALTNEELYQKVRAGDAVAFEQLYGQLEDFIRAKKGPDYFMPERSCHRWTRKL